MKLNSYCVYHFRSIKESGWVECSNRTTLVGVNESGKTNMLLALWKFNPVRDGKIDVLHDMPVTVLSDFRNQKDKIKFISVKFDIDESDLKELSELTGKTIQNLKNITVSRYYDEHYQIEGLDECEYSKQELDDEEEVEKCSVNDAIVQIMPKFVYYSNCCGQAFL